MAKQQKKRQSKYRDVRYTHPVLCPDGKYRWVFDVPMLKNPSILFDVYWVLVISFGIVWLFVLLLGSCEGHLKLSDVWGITYPFLILIGVFLVLGYIAYFFVAWHYGWKYSVLFIMDEKEVVHKQLPGTEDKARAIGKLTALGGAATGKLSMVGMGILVANRTSMTTRFDSVRRLVPRRWMHLIKVNGLLSRNRVYVADEDFDFVYDFLCQYCPNARKG
jgi:hypothetical protein